jgi:putative transposase
VKLGFIVKHRGIWPAGRLCEALGASQLRDNAAMESFFSSLKLSVRRAKIYRTRDEVQADVFGHIARFNNPKRRHSTIGYTSPMEFERQAGLAWMDVNEPGAGQDG